MSKYKIAWLPGDGIGIEVLEATRIVLDALGLDAEYPHGDIGWEFWCREGDALPQRTIDLLGRVDAAMFGAITSKSAKVAETELAPGLRGQGEVRLCLVEGGIRLACLNLEGARVEAQQRLAGLHHIAHLDQHRGDPHAAEFDTQRHFLPGSHRPGGDQRAFQRSTGQPGSGNREARGRFGSRLLAAAGADQCREGECREPACAGTEGSRAGHGGILAIGPCLCLTSIIDDRFSAPRCGQPA